MRLEDLDIDTDPILEAAERNAGGDRSDARCLLGPVHASMAWEEFDRGRPGNDW